MNTPRYDRRTTIHTPMVVISRDRSRLMHSEPRCGAATAPGSTTTDDSRVTCVTCIKILEGE